MSYRWVSFWWKVMWQHHTERETWPSEIKSSITKTMLCHNEITHNAHPATRISLYDNSHRSHSNWNEGRQYLSKISHCPSQCCAWRGTVRSRRYDIATMSNVNCDVSNEILPNHVSYSPLKRNHVVSMYMSYSMSYTWYDVTCNVGICKSKSMLRDTLYHVYDML